MSDKRIIEAKVMIYLAERGGDFSLSEIQRGLKRQELTIPEIMYAISSLMDKNLVDVVPESRRRMPGRPTDRFRYVG
jgi:hypothetical protein